MQGDENQDNEMALAANDGPLDFMYKKVFSVMLKYEDLGITEASEDDADLGQGDFQTSNMMCYFYDVWAEQISTLVERGDDIRLKVPGCCVFENVSREYEEDSQFCIVVGSETTVKLIEEDTEEEEDEDEDDDDNEIKFNTDDSVEIRVTSYPKLNAAGSDARAVDIVLDKTNVGQVDRQQMQEVVTYSSESTKGLLLNGVQSASKGKKKEVRREMS